MPSPFRRGPGWCEGRTRADGKGIANIAQLVEGTTRVGANEAALSRAAKSSVSLSQASIRFSLPEAVASHPYRIALYAADGERLSAVKGNGNATLEIARAGLPRGDVYYRVW